MLSQRSPDVDDDDSVTIHAMIVSVIGCNERTQLVQ